MTRCSDLCPNIFGANQNQHLFLQQVSYTVKWGNIELFSCFRLCPAVFIESFFLKSKFASYVEF